MPNEAKGARLYLRKRKGREPVWVILETGKPERSTRTSNRGKAETLLSEYIAERGRQLGRPVASEDMTVADALTIYAEEHAPTVADPERIGYALVPLLDFWGSLPVSAVVGATCRRYVAERKAAVST